MPAIPLVMVLLAAALHAGWNFLTKRSEHKDILTWWALLCGAILFLPMAAFAWPIPVRVWPFALASALVEVLYYLALVHAYERGDLSLVYPIARGAAPALLTGWAILFLGERPGATGLLGLAVLLIGLVLVAGGHRRLRLGSIPTIARPGGVASALAVALCISVYSVIDGAAVRLMSPAAYTVLVLGLTSLFLLPVVVARHGAAAVLAEGRRSRGVMLAVGVMTVLAYLLVLEAYARAPVSYAGALRETSIVLAAFGGKAFLKEDLGKERLAGATMVFAGILVIALAG